MRPSARPVRHRIARLIAAGATLAVVLPIVQAAPAAAAPVTFTPNNGIAATWTVPDGVFSVELEVVGGKGASGARINDTQSQAAGGFGAIVDATMAVVPGQVLSLVVGEGGGQGGSPGGGVGGAGVAAGGRGGGYSLVRACPTCDDADGLVVAGGGGGGGGRGEVGPATQGGNGAHADQAKGGAGLSGSVFVTNAIGGDSGTTTGVGLGGAAGQPSSAQNKDGRSGNGRAGGAGGNGWSGGGGGGGAGGGYFGGGGGGGGGMDNPSTEVDGGGGGGGAGSSIVLGATQVGALARDTTNTPHITITPVEGPPPATAPPTVTIDRAAGQGDTSWNRPIRFTVQFSEPVTGFTLGDVVVTSAIGAQAQLVTDEGDGRYTVSVGSMDDAGPVTIAIPAAAARDADHNPSFAATAIDDTVTYTRRPGQATDVDGDGSAERIVFREATGEWRIDVGSTPAFAWGTHGDVPVPGDFAGALTVTAIELAIFRPSNGKWYLPGAASSYQYGTAGDLPVPAQWDADDELDIAVFRPSSGRWYVDGQASSVQWGAAGDIPVPGDYDGDGDTDRAVFRPSTGRWYVQGQPTVAWGTVGDVPVPGDYDADGEVDMAVFRPSTGRWYFHGEPTTSLPWGTSGDIPAPGDFDGDGATEVVVYRPTNGRWYHQDGTGPYDFGSSADLPLLLHPAVRAVTYP